jgi:hypothetical protein
MIIVLDHISSDLFVGQKDAIVDFPKGFNSIKIGNNMDLRNRAESLSRNHGEPLTSSKDGIQRCAHLCIPPCFPPFGMISMED